MVKGHHRSLLYRVLTLSCGDASDVPIIVRLADTFF